MTEQEMQFADPEWQPSGLSGQSAPEAPRPQPIIEPGPDTPGTIEEDSDYERGYRAQTPLGDEPYQAYESPQQPGYQQPPGYSSAPRPRSIWRRPWLWILLLLIVISFPFDGEEALFFSRDILLGLVVAGCIALAIFIFNRSRRAPAHALTETRTFTVAAQPSIVIRNNVGTIRVQAGGEQDEVSVHVTRHTSSLFGSAGAASISYNQDLDKNRLTIKANSSWSILGKGSIDFDITVPNNTDLELKTDAGNISAGGVSGQLSLVSNAGSVAASQVILRGDSKLKTDAGSVTFSGALDPLGSYQLRTDAGSITVILPGDASFLLDAKTDVGAIQSDFPLATRRDFPGARATCEVGYPPYPRLKLRADVGSITLRRS